MTTAHHHPGEDLLWDYYRGALAPGLSLAVATHLELCPDCHNDLKLFDAIGGALLNDIEDAPMSDNALDLALARIERPIERPDADSEKPAVVAKRPAFLAGIELPASLQTAAIQDRYWAAPGVWMAPVVVPDAPKGSKTFLMHVKAGMAMPAHTHRGMEITVMLAGRYSDHKGTYARGDFSLCDDSDDRHCPVMQGDEDCMCLVAQ